MYYKENVLCNFFKEVFQMDFFFFFWDATTHYLQRKSLGEAADPSGHF